MNMPPPEKFRFDVGWKYDITLTMFNTDYPVILKARAYRETDLMTTSQKEAIQEFIVNNDIKVSNIEKTLSDKFGDETEKRFVPTMILFKRNGNYALLLDDAKEPDDGIAIILSNNNFNIISQDEYL